MNPTISPKTPQQLRTIANPRRTTLMHLGDATELPAPVRPEHSQDLPASTANPRRTVLMNVPLS
ncbi:hypothetical protein [Streptomyces sp. NPDC058953]|uniref:hypothetical protein n=1 Tax=unclassified Streptomyces TaxID=2593676 RepID=UPI0036CA8D43